MRDKKTPKNSFYIVTSFMSLIFFSPGLLSRQPDRVNINLLGRVFDTPCDIATSAQDQTIQIDFPTINQLLKKGSADKGKIHINLLNCDLDTKNVSESNWSEFKGGFAGNYDSGYFYAAGAKGVGIQISDDMGNVAVPGKALPREKILTGTQYLEYTYKLADNIKKPKQQVFNFTIRFISEYF
ncbi:TPA: type 1 fimbrial protein [Klebsiella aerogenes]|nr:type 1 fimbrial protein [Klebsiella aerogenes]